MMGVNRWRSRVPFGRVGYSCLLAKTRLVLNSEIHLPLPPKCWD
ncbi:Mtfr1 [Phodopus roborovskii]|uniref:Mtfr1 protein n=1 Tax=Phodopus roborovskii TaxID=109678 RepID=A0AAU9Z0A7_PHORO|nr:Mtfr1 [Phodopus roborovskii]